MISYIPYVIPIGIGKSIIYTARYSDALVITYTAATGSRLCIFTKVLYVLELSINLLSTELLRLKGVFYCSDRQQLFITYTDSIDIVIADVHIYNSLPYLVIELLIVTAITSSKVARKAEATILV